MCELTLVIKSYRIPGKDKQALHLMNQYYWLLKVTELSDSKLS
jgi:hypothetical protein